MKQGSDMKFTQWTETNGLAGREDDGRLYIGVCFGRQNLVDIASCKAASGLSLLMLLLLW